MVTKLAEKCLEFCLHKKADDKDGSFLLNSSEHFRAFLGLLKTTS